MDEFLEVVSSSNKLTGVRRSRDLIHRNGDWHRAAHIWVMNNKNEVLCNKRGMRKAFFAGRWDMIFGGHVKSGASYKSTAIEELSEELGLKINGKSLKFLGNFRIEIRGPKDLNREFVRAYLLKTRKHVKDFKVHRDEISRISYFSFAEIEKLRKSGRFAPAWNYYKDVLGRIKSIH